MDLALTNPQKLLCPKSQTNKQWQQTFWLVFLHFLENFYCLYFLSNNFLECVNCRQLELWCSNDEYCRNLAWLIESVYVYIMITMLCNQCRYPWPFLATLFYRPLLPADLQSYISYWHRAAVCRFYLVVQPLLVHVKDSTGVHHLWVHPYFSSSVPHVWFV